MKNGEVGKGEPILVNRVQLASFFDPLRISLDDRVA